MSHHATDFEMEVDFGLPSSPSLGRQFKKSPIMDDIVELLWQNGQVVTQSQTQRYKPSSPLKFDTDPANQSINEQQNSLFAQENDMVASCPWLQYPITSPDFDENEQFCSDFFYPPPHSTVTASIQGINPLKTLPQLLENPRVNSASARESSTVVDSNATPAISSSALRATLGFFNRDNKRCTTSKTTGITESVAAANSNSSAYHELPTSSNEGSTSSDQPLPVSPIQDPAADDELPHDTLRSRKRKSASRANSAELLNVEETEAEFVNTRKTAQKSTSKRSRAAEVHNLSERRRRDRINEKMRALQELIPRCNKSDKASMLDEAIEYLKSLQLQVQMMSMGCGMMPMMFPGMQQYMGMGLGMDMGMNRPMMPFANLNPRFPLPAFQVPPMDTSRGRTAVPDAFNPFLVQNTVRGGNGSSSRPEENGEKKQ